MLRKWITLIFVGTLSIASAQEGTPDEKSYWGWSVGGVFTDIPISVALDSGFAVIMANAYYGHLLNDPADNFRTALTLGVYGFQIILPVPAVGVDLFVGQPNQDVQFKGSLGGFYDITVGGHAGAYLGAGVLLKNRFNVSFFMVPFGKDADRDYLEFVGMRDNEANCDEVDCVKMPYFGLFAGFQY